MVVKSWDSRIVSASGKGNVELLGNCIGDEYLGWLSKGHSVKILQERCKNPKPKPLADVVDFRFQLVG